MNANFAKSLSSVLKHEGGYVNHPKDPGGPTNKGITIGTLRMVGIDVDGDGDTDVSDLKAIRPDDVAKVYRLFYWDKVLADHLPSGLDYVMFDYAVNSGPSRAVKTLQKALGIQVDGEIGPVTIAAVAKADATHLVNRVCDLRMEFLKNLKTWTTFGKGWARRVSECRLMGLSMVGKAPKLAPQPPPHSPAPTTPPSPESPPVTQSGDAKPPMGLAKAFLSLIAFIFAAFKPKG